jgi:hypothetical protein
VPTIVHEFRESFVDTFIFADIVYHIVEQHDHTLTRLANVIEKMRYASTPTLARDKRAASL